MDAADPRQQEETRPAPGGAGDGPSFRVPGVETEPAARGVLPGVLRFFVVPLLLVGASVGVFAVLGAVVGRAPPAPEELVDRISGGGTNSRWQAAQELSNLVYRRDVDLSRNDGLARTLAESFRKARAAGDDPRVVSLLASLLGRCPAEVGRPALEQALADGNPDVRVFVLAALGETGDPASLDAMLPSLQDPDASVRAMAAYAVPSVAGPAVAGAGDAPGAADGRAALVRALEDASVDVRWNAALGLSRLGHADGADLVWSMLHRDYVRGNLRPREGGGPGILSAAGADPETAAQAEEKVVLNALSAAWLLRDRSMIEGVRALADSDPSPSVRDWALRARGRLEDEIRDRGPVPARAWTAKR